MEILTLSEIEQLEIKIQPKKGRLLMFPPNWSYPHIGEKVFDKPKYILGTYCEYVA